MGGGGGIGNGGTLVITHSLIDRNGSDEGYGGGISNSGTLTIRKSTVTRNRSIGGSGIFNSGTLTISQSAIIENSTTPAGSGGGIWNGGGTLVIMNSTIAANSAPFGGAGGILASGTVTITNSTLADNSAGAGSERGIGGGISAADGATVELLNTILARNTVGSFGAGPDCAGPITSLNNNLIGDPMGCTITLLPSDLTGDPGLDAFTDNGRPGNGHFPLLSTSQAIDAGDNAVCPRTDQLGRRRIGPCDIGAIRFLDKDDRRHKEENDNQHEEEPAAAAQASQ